MFVDELPNSNSRLVNYCKSKKEGTPEVMNMWDREDLCIFLCVCMWTWGKRTWKKRNCFNTIMPELNTIKAMQPYTCKTVQRVSSRLTFHINMFSTMRYGEEGCQNFCTLLLEVLKKYTVSWLLVLFMLAGKCTDSLCLQSGHAPFTSSLQCTLSSAPF